MLHKETVSPSTLELLTTLMKDCRLKHFVLVGGTSLSLQLGHRISVDLDLFSDLSFDESELSSYLVENYDLEMDFISRSTLKGEIRGVQIDVFRTNILGCLRVLRKMLSVWLLLSILLL